MELRPVVLWPKNGDGDKYQTFSDQHMQRYTCSVARYLLGSILAEMGGRLEAVFMYNACDTLRNLPEIVECGLARQGCSRSVMKMHLPMVSLSRPDAESYLKEEVRSLVQTLEHRFCRGFRISAFQKSVELYRSARRLGLELVRNPSVQF
jgi:benzoyl-CoA reductase/2-hydroxyglutaryl-CoA dehydratase subunit BcrC/BadD/HgdB